MNHMSSASQSRANNALPPSPNKSESNLTRRQILYQQLQAARPNTSTRLGFPLRSSPRATSPKPTSLAFPNSNAIAAAKDNQQRLNETASANAAPLAPVVARLYQQRTPSSSNDVTRYPSGTEYWAVATRSVQARDIGHKCKECGLEFANVGDEMVLRRGGRIELKYHKRCFVGNADPRSQPNSSYANTSNHLPSAAPSGKYNKMRTSSQF